MRFFHKTITLQISTNQYIADDLFVCNMATKYPDNKKLDMK